MHSQNDRTVSGSQTETFVGFIPKVYHLRKNERILPISSNYFVWSNAYTIISKPYIQYWWERSETTFQGWKDHPSSFDSIGTLFVDCRLKGETITKECRLQGFTKSDNDQDRKLAMADISKLISQVMLAYNQGIEVDFGHASSDSARVKYRNVPSRYFSAIRKSSTPVTTSTTVPSVDDLQGLYNKLLK